MIQLQTDPIDVLAVEQSVYDPACGAHIVFVGRTRDHFEGKKVLELHYEAYESMALKEMNQIAHDLKARYEHCRVSIVHRLGIVDVGEASVVIAVSTPHRKDCYEASRYAIDTLKKTVTIWKKEICENKSHWKANQ